MRINHPITQAEVQFSKSTSIVSKTDPKGKITYINRDFVDVSGFKESELLGQPHNMVRHPDMPPAAFDDMWSTLKADKPWNGIVKNRCKNGDYYWVEANVVPLRKSGMVTGYLSVRSQPTRQQVNEAEKLYGDINARRVNPFKRNIFDKLASKFGPITLRKRLSLAFGGSILLAGASYFVPGNELAATALMGAAITLGSYQLARTIAYINKNTAEAVRILDDIANGDFSRPIKAGGDDEISRIINMLAGVQLRIRADLREAEFTAAETDRLKSALDYVPITFTTGKNTLAYMSKSAEELWRKLTPEIRTIHPDFAIENLLGGELHKYVDDSRDWPEFLANIREPVSVNITVGRFTVRMAINPAYNHQGDFIGSITRWVDRTAEVAAEKEIAKLVENAIKGDLSHRVDTKTLPEGFLLDTGIGINRMLDAMAGPMDMAAGCIDDIAHGNIPQRITAQYHGDFNLIKENLNRCIDAINGLVVDAVSLSKSAVNGDLRARADASRHQGDFRKIIEGVNSTLDALIEPLNVTAECVSRISRGDIPEPITAAYKGDFNVIIQNLNTCINSINGLITDASSLAGAAVKGQLSARANPDAHQGDFRKIIEGVNQTLDALITPLNVAVDCVSRISRGDVPTEINGDYKGDFNIFIQNLNTLIKSVNLLVVDANMLADAAGEGYVSKRADVTRHYGDFRKIIEGFNETLEVIATPIMAVKDASNAINTAVKEIALGNADLSSRTEEQASSLDETVSSMEEISSTVKHNADSANAASQLAVNATDIAVKGGEVVKKVVDTMTDISRSATKIEEIISVIDGIAFQTNILALNAAVEAARAGEQGRGFAVVAGEVRGLAQRSASAAREIKDIITDSVSKTTEGAELANSAGRTMVEIVNSVKNLSELIGEIAHSSIEQSTGVDQVNVALSKIDEFTQQNAALVEQGTAAATSLLEQTEGMSRAINVFKIEPEKKR